MKNIRHIHPRKKHKILERDNFTCKNCGITADFTALEVDHIIPVCKGGSNDISNLQTLCYKCNMSKSDGKSISKWSKIQNMSPRVKLESIKTKLKEYNDLSWNEFKVLFTQDSFFKDYSVTLLDLYDLWIDMGGLGKLRHNDNDKYMKQRSILLKILNNNGFTHENISNLLKKEGIILSRPQIGRIILKNA